MNHFKGKQFQQDVIIVAVGYYLRYNLSYREVQEILYDRGINVSHTTIYRWVQEYGKLLYQIWKKKNKKSFYSWKMDETYIKIKGKWHYLYRAIDAELWNGRWDSKFWWINQLAIKITCYLWFNMLYYSCRCNTIWFFVFYQPNSTFWKNRRLMVCHKQVKWILLQELQELD